MDKIFFKCSIDYDFSFIYDLDWEIEKTLYLEFKKKENIETIKIYGNYPDSLNDYNTYIYQKFFNNQEVNYEKLGKQLNMDLQTVSVIKQRPGTVIPIHHDAFFRLAQKYPESAHRAMRANIFLEDWEWGHFFQIDNVNPESWLKNTGYIFNNKVIHSSANASFKDKYTLQCTGFLNE